MSALRRRKPWFSCFLQSVINVLIAAARRWHPSSGDDVAKVKSASMAWTLSAKTYSADKLCTRADTGLSGCFMYYFCMILQMHCASQIHVALRMRACDRLTFWMVAEVFTMEVLFQVAVTVEGP